MVEVLKCFALRPVGKGAEEGVAEKLTTRPLVVLT
jgi:hypothetical protein